jgi:ankyrin repeat protein
MREIDKELLNACWLGNTKKVKTLIAEGANVNVVTYRNATPLLVAAKGGYIEIVKLLIEFGGDVNAKDEDGNTALHLISKEDFEIGKLLIEKGIDVNAEDEEGATPLYYIEGEDDDTNDESEDEVTPLINLLKEKGAVKKLPLDAQLIKASKDGNIELVKDLIKQGASVNARNSYGTPLLLIVASKEGERFSKILKILLDNGADINNQDFDIPDYGETALHAACEIGDIDRIKMLIERGANINIRNEFGDTPLHCAVLWGDIEVVKLLINNGADVNIKDGSYEGCTPLEWAIKENNIEIIKLLKEAGAKE